MEAPAIVVGVPHEHAAGETRVALTPDAVERLQTSGIAVLVERSAGAGAGFADEQYREAGAEIAADAVALHERAGVIARVAPPGRERGGAVAPRNAGHRAALPFWA